MMEVTLREGDAGITDQLNREKSDRPRLFVSK